MVQSKIVGVLWLVPIYAIDSWLSLRFKEWALTLGMLRDCYEAYVLYLFLALMVGYLGGGDEYKVEAILEGCPRVEHTWPFTWLTGEKHVPHGRKFLRWAKRGLLQYSLVKPLAAALALTLASFGLYEEGSFSFREPWLYISVVVNMSVCYAFYALGRFYVMLKAELQPFRPLPKFLCIKAVLFVSFWQGIAVATLARCNLIHGIGDWSKREVETGLQDLLVCVEMLIVAAVHTSAFSAEPYEGGGVVARSQLLEDHFAYYSTVRDFNEVMPVLLPSNFKPGPAKTALRIPTGELDPDLESSSSLREPLIASSSSSSSHK